MYDTFISYRRIGGASTAARLYDYLKLKDLKPFYDIDGMRAGRFDEQLRSNLIGSLNFVLILSKNALDRCSQEGDWVKEEILTAIEHNLNIIILIEEGFEFPADLPDDIAILKNYQMIEYTAITLTSRMDMLVSMLNRRNVSQEAPTYEHVSDKKVKFSGEYMTYYEDFEGDRVIMRKAPATLKEFMGMVWGETWFDATQAWKIRGKKYGAKRIAGTYFASSCLDDGFGTFFLEAVDANTLEGFWSGYDNVNKKATAGRYIFKRKYDRYTIRVGKTSDFAKVIKIADKRLGADYVSIKMLEEVADPDTPEEILVAEEKGSDNIIGFVIFKQINHNELKDLGRGYEFKELVFEDKIGYVATVAVQEEYSSLGVATSLVRECMERMRAHGSKRFVSTAWKHAGVINIQSILENAGFRAEVDIPKYWHEASIRDGFKCPQCGNPCNCSCVIFVKI